MSRVLVIREESRAGQTEDRLARQGHEAVLMPLMRHRDLGKPLPDAAVDALAYSSATAPELMAARNGVEPFAELPCFCVGGATASAARKAGHREVVTAGGDGPALAAAILRHAASLPTGRLLYPAPRQRAFDLVAALPGFKVILFELYETLLIDPGAGPLRAVLEACDVVLLHSPRAAAHFVELALRHGGPELLAGLTLIAISEKTARAARGSGLWPVLVAEMPDEASMLSLLPGRSTPD